MRISDALASFAMIAAGLLAVPAHAFDPSGATIGTEMPLTDASALSAVPPTTAMNLGQMPGLMEATTSNVVEPSVGATTTAAEAFNAARNLYRRGEKGEAMNALQFAAGQGHVGARWMMGRMYARGEGVAHDDLKAFESFRQVVSSVSGDEIDDSPESRQNAGYVSHALVQLGSYYREGIPGTSVKPDPQLAVSLYSRAAYNYGDPSAQFNLAMMYVEGNGVPKDPRRAMQLFNNAAKKGHGPSRALLGHMMFKGEVGKRQPELGLMWMNLARQSAEQSGEPDAQWIIDLHDKALAQSSEAERTGARGFLDRLFKN